MYLWLVLHPIALLFIHYGVLSALADASTWVRFSTLAFTAAVTTGITMGCSETVKQMPENEVLKAALMVGANSFVCLSFPSGEPVFAIAIPAAALNVIIMLFVAAQNG